MTPSKTARTILEEFVGNFASKEKDGTYWGHDTDLGTCEECFDQALKELAEMFTVGELEGFLNNIFLKGKTRKEKAIALHALISTKLGGEIT
jgi:hypothetical protein